MDADSADRIVDLQLLLDILVAEESNDRTESTDQKCPARLQHVTARGYGNKRSEHSAQGLFRQHDAILLDPDDIADTGAHATGQDRVENDRRHVCAGGEGRAAVEADPAEKQDQGAGGRQHRVVTGDPHGSALGIEPPLPRADHQAGRECYPPARRMDHGRTGKIDEAEIGQEGARIRAKCRTPDPMHEDGIDEGREHDRTQDISRERHALRNCARYDRCRRTAKHDLEDEEAGEPAVEVLKQEEIRVQPDRQCAGRTEGQHETDCGKSHDTEDEVQKVLLGDVDRVLRAHHAGFQEQETDLHHHHHAGSRHQPGKIGGCLRRLGRRRLVGRNKRLRHPEKDARCDQTNAGREGGAKRNNHMKNPSNMSGSVLRCTINIR